MSERFIGIDIGAETVKVAELSRTDEGLRWTRRLIREHHKDPRTCLREILADWDWPGVSGAAVSGRLSRQVRLDRIPLKQAQASGYRFLHGEGPGTLVSIGSHGFSVLELLPSGMENFRENSRCSQGTGNFLRQLVERFDLTVEEASRLCEDVPDPAPLSGRCPVILKTDMTHLANKGEASARILAGLYDAVCENVSVLIKPRTSPGNVRLIGGVGRSKRIRSTFESLLARQGLALEPADGDDDLYYEALGCAGIAASRRSAVPALDSLLHPPPENGLERVPSLRDSLSNVEYRTREPLAVPDVGVRSLVLGFDIGSTGSKAVAMDADRRTILQEEYVNTNGDPVGASQELMDRLARTAAGRFPVHAVAVTGSGREIVGSLMTTCYGRESVYVLNEIAAHAEGALSYDPEVDTIFEIGGQDAKYIRLEGGRVIDAAMNEACSAGTGSFIEEQGRKFADIRDVVHLGETALEANSGISLGQHCSVFMAEVIDECAAVGVDQRSVIAGLYDSVIQNYLNRVKGNRDVGRVIFCQGMPFSSPALAAAVARQTGSRVIVPPSPGTVGALGISLLAMKNLALEDAVPLDTGKYLETRLDRKDTFVCKSTEGCGGAGNRCRIDRISTVVAGEKKRFTWGGGCSLHDRGTGRKKLPDRSPDPFRRREELIRAVVERVSTDRGRETVALTDEFMLKGLFPFFATYLHELGFDLVVHTGATQEVLKRGIESANVPFCAPMQLFHGIVGILKDESPDYLFLPMLRSLPRVDGEENAVVCPIGQASPDILRWDLGLEEQNRVISTVIDIGLDGLESEEFLAGCRGVASDLGIQGDEWRSAYRIALEEQSRFDDACADLGREALEFCAGNDVVPVVVLGRSYTIYNTVLNSNVPAILREQGVVAIPMDCYPVEEDVPVFDNIYWGQSQRNLRAAFQIRNTPGIYSLFCSNYACGPDSFSIHFYAYLMEGKPFAVIETDGHSGDAGTKTRVEAFLYCVQEDLHGDGQRRQPGSLTDLEREGTSSSECRERGDTMLLPYFSPMAHALAASFRGSGLKAEVLPVPDQDALRIGRRHTSGKECIPMCITLGSFLQRIENDPDKEKRFSLLMPSARGPCRFGVYNLAQKIVMERLDLRDRVRLWSPRDRGYFADFAETHPGFSGMAITGIVTVDMLSDALFDVRPVETRPGAAEEIHARYQQELIALLERIPREGLPRSRTIREIVSGRLFGCADLLRRAGEEFRAVKGDVEIPTALVVGEIYVRLEPFSNGFIVNQLERRGIRAKLVPSAEWFEYVSFVNHESHHLSDLGPQIAFRLQKRVHERCYSAIASRMGWPRRTTVADSLDAASPYVRGELRGEAVLTVGGPIHEWREGHIDAAVSVGPLECMPNKIAESQMFHAAQRENMPSLTLSLNGDPIDPEVLDNFAYEVHESFRKRRAGAAGGERRWTGSAERRLAGVAALLPRSLFNGLNGKDRRGS